MAFKEVAVDPVEQSGTFFKFNAIGDRLLGVFLRTEKRTVTFRPDEGPREVTTYFFRTKEGDVSLDPTVDLARRFEKAQLKPGYKVIATYVADIPNANPARSAMKQFKLLVDDEVSAPKAPPPPADDFDDIPF